jgi:hypothetical protein
MKVLTKIKTSVHHGSQDSLLFEYNQMMSTGTGKAICSRIRDLFKISPQLFDMECNVRYTQILLKRVEQLVELSDYTDLIDMATPTSDASTTATPLPHQQPSREDYVDHLERTLKRVHIHQHAREAAERADRQAQAAKKAAHETTIQHAEAEIHNNAEERESIAQQRYVQARKEHHIANQTQG